MRLWQRDQQPEYTLTSLPTCPNNQDQLTWTGCISQFPFAVEVVFCVGPYQIHIDRQTLQTTGTDHQHRSLIPKPNGAVVPTDTFFDPKFSPISGIWAVDGDVSVDENLLAGQSGPMVVVHNPIAAIPIPTNFLPAHAESIATDHGDHYKLERCDGRLNQSR
jgi:hypothetical protein